MSKVTVNVPQEKAFERAETRWGDLPIDNFEDVLKTLSVDERVALSVVDERLYLIVSNGFDIRIKANSTRTEDVVSAIRKELAICNAKREEERKEAEKELDEILKNPEECFSERNIERLYSKSKSEIERLAEKTGRDPEVYENALDNAFDSLKKSWTEQVLGCLREDRKLDVNGSTLYYSQIKDVAENHNISEILEILKVREEAEEKQKEEKESQKEASRLVWLEWAKINGSEDLKLAIEDDYPLGEAVEKEVLGFLFPEETDDLTVKISVQSNEDRRVPNKKAREARAYLVQQTKTTIPPQGTELFVGRIQSVEIYAKHDCIEKDYCDECDRDGDILLKRTAVPVTVKAAHLETTRWYIVNEE